MAFVWITDKDTQKQTNNVYFCQDSTRQESREQARRNTQFFRQGPPESFETKPSCGAPSGSTGWNASLRRQPTEFTTGPRYSKQHLPLDPSFSQGFTSRFLLASTTRSTTSSKSGKAFLASLENTRTPLISTSKEVVRPTVPITVALGTLLRICRLSSSKRGAYPHPPQYSTCTLTAGAFSIF